MITNVATALIGVGDMWIVGQLQDAPTQGAVDVGARLFAVLFTVMNFLKTGTTGMVAQAGAKTGQKAQMELLARGMVVGLTIAVLLILAKPVLMPFALSLLGAEAHVLKAATIYADIRYWTAPGVMLNLALIGYLVGRRQMRAVLMFEVAYNLINVGLGLWFVLALDFGIAGIGWSSFIAEYAKLLAVGAFVLAGLRGSGNLNGLDLGRVIGWAQLRPFLSINRDLFLRTLVLVVSFAAITRLSAERGAVVLAANGIIYQLFILTALILDGFENAAQVLNGERLGANDRAGFAAYVRAILIRGIGAAAIIAASFALFAAPVLESFSATPAVFEASNNLAIWLVILPFAGVTSFIFDGVFVGASWTRAMLISMCGSAVILALSLWLSWPWGAHGLWASFVLFLIARASLQAILLPGLMRRHFDGNIAK